MHGNSKLSMTSCPHHQNSPPKTRPNSHAPWNQNNGVRLSWRVGIMIYTAFCFQIILWPLLSYLCWHGNKSKNKRKMLTVLYCFLRKEKCPLKNPISQFPNAKSFTHRWNISVAKHIKIRPNVYGRPKQNCAVFWGYSYWTIFSATRIKIKTQHFSIVLIIQHRDYNAKPIRDGNSKRWGWGRKNLFIFGKLTQKTLRGWNFGKMRP